MIIRHAALRNWKQRRNDKKTEVYWERNSPTSTWEEYQKEWNFIETDYSSTPSNNGYDTAHPAFAFETKLQKHIQIVDVEIRNRY